MARPIRLEYAGALYHVHSRGNAKQPIYLDDADRELFLDLLGTCAKRHAWMVFAYALMTNHFHLLIQLTGATLSRGMQWLNGVYTQTFNRRHGRVGHLMQGRFKAPLVEKRTYFLELLRYVVLNPVRAGLVSTPDEYRWTSHRALLGKVAAPAWLRTDLVLAEFAPHRRIARAAYEDFVNAGIGVKSDLWCNLVAQAYLGSDEWLSEVRQLADEKLRADDHPAAQRLVASPTMTSIVDVVAQTINCGVDRLRQRGNTTPRMVAAWIASNEARLTNRQIAAGLRLRSSGHVSDLVRRCDRELSLKPALRHYVDVCLSTLRRKTGHPKL